MLQKLFKMDKDPLKSKTFRGLIVAAVIIALGLSGIGEDQIGQICGAIFGADGPDPEFVKGIVALGGIVFAGYGRTRVGKDKKNDSV